MIREQPHAERATEILSDGEWHDGLALCVEAEKAIAPGPAARMTERERASTSRMRHGQARERVREIDMAAAVRIGKRAMMRKLVTDRRTDGTWEARPWPLPKGAWRVGGWEIRDLRVHREALTSLKNRLRLPVSHATLRALVFAEPPLRTEVRNSRTYLYLTELSTLEERIKDHVSRRGERVAAGNRNREPRCSHCRKPLGDYATYRNLRLCHPQSGMDCYALVKHEKHGTKCEKCIGGAS